MFRKFTYLLIVGSLYLIGLLLFGCSQTNQDSNITQPTTFATATPIPPTSTPTPRVETLRVNQLTSSNLTFQENEFVWVQPSGEVKVGPFVGFVSPQGDSSLFLTGYSIAPAIPHGALMCRIKGQAEWYYCGEEFAVRSEVTGQLEFQVNDNDQGNNDSSTAFTVRITVAPYPIEGQLVNAQQQSNDQGESNLSQESSPDSTDNTANESTNSYNDDSTNSPTDGCQHRQGDDSYCQSICLNHSYDPNCSNVNEYNQEQEKQQQFEEQDRKQRAEEEERRQRQEQEEQQRRQQDEEERQRQQQEQQQENSSSN